MTDESAIRDLQRRWFTATMDGDVATICELITNDVVFLTAGRPPFGRKDFIESFNAMKEHVEMICEGEYEEIVVAGDVAFTRARLSIRVSPRNGGTPKQMFGYTLSVFRRSDDGRWQLCRDANMLAPAAM